jgi:hypothetical protein
VEIMQGHLPNGRKSECEGTNFIVDDQFMGQLIVVAKRGLG